MIKNFAFKILLQLYYVIRTSLTLCYFSKIWKLALVMAFPKPGKPASSPANYRPVCRVFLAKFLKKVVHAQICLHLISENIIINEQFGFKREHSTVSQFLRVTEFFAFEINKRRNSAMLLLDLKKAFDSVWHNVLLYKLHLIRLPTYLIKLLRSYLLERSFAMIFQSEHSSYYDVISGVPQGSILGPVLFNINDIPKFHNTQLAVYADDTAIYTSSWSVALLKSRLQRHVDDILQFFSDWMSINSEKTEAVIFTRRSIILPPLVNVDGYGVPWSKTVQIPFY